MNVAATEFGRPAHPPLAGAFTIDVTAIKFGRPEARHKPLAAAIAMDLAATEFNQPAPAASH